MMPVNPSPANSIPGSSPNNSVELCPAPTVSDPASSLIPAKGQYPAGDFRNLSPEDVLDTQTTIMVHWLRQMQREKLWTAALTGEGVILKKNRDSYACCPESLKDESPGFYTQIVGMKVRVC
jgi:hypothetical protein